MYGAGAHSLGDIDGDGLSDYDEFVECVSSTGDNALFLVQNRHDAGGMATARWTPATTPVFLRTLVRDEPGWIGDATGDGLDDVMRADVVSRRLMLFVGTSDGLSGEPSVTIAYPSEANGEAEFAHAF